MSDLVLVLVGLFLPLFPLSMVSNGLLQRVTQTKLRLITMLLWPQIGIAIVSIVGIEIPAWIIFWAMLTSVLYGFRALALREVGMWSGFIATSAWALLWLTIDSETSWLQLAMYGIALSIPLALLLSLAKELQQRFGAAYTDLYGGLALSVPRLSGVLVFVVLAVVATPLFPGFSVMLAAIVESTLMSLVVAIGVGISWLLWSWAGARLLQGLIVGPAHDESSDDLTAGQTWAYSIVLIILAIGGIVSIGNLS